MSGATRTAEKRPTSESRRGSPGNLVMFALGIPLAAGLLYAISSGAIDNAELQRYTQFPVQKGAVVLFCCALCALLGKLCRALVERATCVRPPLPEWDGRPIAASEVGALQQQLALQPVRMRQTYLGRRITAVLEFVACRRRADDLDAPIRCLADND